MSPWRFVDGGALAESVPRRLVLVGAVEWVDAPPAEDPPPPAEPDAPSAPAEVEFTPSAVLDTEVEPAKPEPRKALKSAPRKTAPKKATPVKKGS